MKMSSIVALLATLISIVVYIILGLRLGWRTRSLSDHLPVTPGHLARVENTNEFSASTVATTISLATVVMAFFELVPYFGVWLFWTVVTTSIGLVVVRLAAKRIWSRMADYGAHRPTLHEFLGLQYGTSSVALIGAACTSLGFLGAFAVELTVGSRFLANLVPFIPPFLLVVVLALVALTYTSAGGFRAVIVTDQIQMKAIWLLLGALSIFYVVYLVMHGAPASLAKVPQDTLSFSWRDGLGAFLLGIFVINVPTFLSDMSVWQRIAGSQEERVVFQGLWRSVIGTMITWALFVILACLVPVVTNITPDVNPLLTLINALTNEYVTFGLLTVFFVVLGLYGAMLSTASTQLVAVSHTIYLDIIQKIFKPTANTEIMPLHQVRTSRIIISVCAIAAMVVVVILSAAGFSIADLVFAIYGAQLGLFPPTLLALFYSKDKLKHLAPWAAGAIAAGFILGWATAGYGKVIGDGNIVFLAPISSLVISFLILGIGTVFNLKNRKM